MSFLTFPVTGNYQSLAPGGVIKGTVKFTSNVLPGIPPHGVTGGVTYGMLPESTFATLKNGVLTPSSSFAEQVTLTSNDPQLHLSGALQYTVDFLNVTVDGQPVTVNSFTFNAPADGTPVDLVAVSPGTAQQIITAMATITASQIGDADPYTRGLLTTPTDAASARSYLGINAATVRRPLNNSAVAIGDSITAANSTGYIGLLGDMWFNHLCIDTEQRIQYAGYFATAGFTLANIQSTHLPTVLAMNPLPGACAVFGGTNDMGAWGTGGASFTASKTVLRAIVASLLAAGVVPMLCTIPPITNSTAAVNQNTVTWNTWIRRYATTNGFPLIDANSALIGSNGAYASGLDSGDGVHPNQKGHRAIAQRAIDDGVFESFPNARPRTSRSSADLSNMFGSGTASYGLFLTNTAGVGTGLTASGTGYTASIVAPTAADDLQGNWQQLSRTTGNTGTATLTSGSLTGGWSVGDVLAFSFRAQAEQLFESATTFYVMLWNGAPTNSHAGLYLFESDLDGLFYVEIPTPTGAAFAYWELQMSAVGGTGNPTVRVGEVTVRNLTTGGILT